MRYVRFAALGAMMLVFAAALPAFGQAASDSFDAQKFEDRAKELFDQFNKPDFDLTQFQQDMRQLMQDFRDATQNMTPDQVDQIRQKMMEHLQPLIIKSMPMIIQRMREGYLTQIRADLECTDEEFTALKPGIIKIMDAMQAAGVNRGPRMGGGARFGGGMAASPVTTAQQELQQVLADPNSKGDLIQAKLEALRRAKEQANHDLEVARAELRGLLTVRQESALVEDGLLE